MSMIRCPTCKTEINIEGDMDGQFVNCPRCDERLRLPKQPTAVAPKSERDLWSDALFAAVFIAAITSAAIGVILHFDNDIINHSAGCGITGLASAAIVAWFFTRLAFRVAVIFGAAILIWCAFNQYLNGIVFGGFLLLAGLNLWKWNLEREGKKS